MKLAAPPLTMPIRGDKAARMDQSDPGELGAIVLTGGASSRMGEDKASQAWGERRAVDLVAALARSVGAARVVTAGGGDFGLPWAADPAPFSGPVAGLVRGADMFGPAFARLLVLAVDAPTLLADDLAPLLAAPAPGASYRSLPLPMVVSRAAIPPDAEGGWPLKRVVERAGLAQLEPPDGALARLRGANTPDERARLLSGRP